MVPSPFWRVKVGKIGFSESQFRQSKRYIPICLHIASDIPLPDLHVDSLGQTFLHISGNDFRQVKTGPVADSTGYCRWKCGKIVENDVRSEA